MTICVWMPPETARSLLIELRRLTVEAKTDNLPKTLDLIKELSMYFPELPKDKPLPKDSGVGHLELTVRAFNGLKDLGCETIGDLLQLSEVDLLRQPNMGKKSVKLIKEQLALNGYELAVRRRER